MTNSAPKKSDFEPDFILDDESDTEKKARLKDLAKTELCKLVMKAEDLLPERDKYLPPVIATLEWLQLLCAHHKITKEQQDFLLEHIESLFNGLLKHYRLDIKEFIRLQEKMGRVTSVQLKSLEYKPGVKWDEKTKTWKW